MHTEKNNGLNLFTGEKEDLNKKITLSDITSGTSPVYVSEVILSILEYLDKVEEEKEIAEKMRADFFREQWKSKKGGTYMKKEDSKSSKLVDDIITSLTDVLKYVRGEKVEGIRVSKIELSKTEADITKPLPPLPSLGRILREGGVHICDKCHSSIKTNWYGKKLGCIQPKCSNYYKKRK